MYQHLVFASAMQPTESKYIHKAQKLAKSMGAEFSLVHIYEIPGILQLAQGLGFAEIATPSREDLEMLFSTYAAGFSIESKNTMLRMGELWPSLSDAIKALKADLLIIGEHHTKVSEAFLHHKKNNDGFACDILTLY